MDNENNIPVEGAATVVATATRKKTGLIVVACVLALALMATAVGVIVWSNTRTSPVENTLMAVFGTSPAPVLEAFGDKGGEIYCKAKLDQDLIGNEDVTPVDINASLKIDPDVGGNLVASMKMAGETLDASLLVNKHGVQIGSKAFLDDGTYYVRLDNFKKALDESVFAPGSGSPYAIPQPVYDLLVSFLDGDMTDMVEMGRKMEIIREAISEIADDVEDSVKVTESKEDVKVYDGTTKATVTTYALDQTFFAELADAIKDEWTNNREFRKAVQELWDSMAESQLGSSAIGGTKVDVGDLVNELCAVLNKISKEMDLTCELSVAVRKDYLVRATLNVSAKDKDEKESVEVALDCVFCESPKKDQSFRVILNVEYDDVTVAEMLIESSSEKTADATEKVLTIEASLAGAKFELEAKTQEKDGATTCDVQMDLKKGERMLRLTLAAEHKKDNALTFSLVGSEKELSDAAYREAFRLDIGGTLVNEATCVELTVDHLVVGADGNDIFEMDQSSFTIGMKAGKPQVAKELGGTDLMKISEEQLTEVLEKVADRWKAFAEAAGLNSGKQEGGCTHEAMVYMPYTEATCTESGNDEFWFCYSCMGCFLDKEGRIPGSMEKMIHPAHGHKFDGECCVFCGLREDET